MVTRVAILVGLVCAAPGALAAACPSNHLKVAEISVDSTLPTDERHFSDAYRDADAYYSVPGATLGMQFSSVGQVPNSATAIIEDDFKVVGVPDGAQVPLVAHLVVTFHAFTQPGIGSYVTTHLEDALGHDVTVSNPNQDPGTYDLTLPVQAVGGQTFRLHFEVTGFGTGDPGDASAAFSFARIPPGVAVTSCQGYISDPAVPAHGFTWGRVRTLYR